MKVRCYEDGDESRAREYSMFPSTAVRLFAEERSDDDESTVDVVVEPLDDEALSLGKWHAPPPDDVGGLPFRMFKVWPEKSVTWRETEVQTFNHAAEEP